MGINANRYDSSSWLMRAVDFLNQRKNRENQLEIARAKNANELEIAQNQIAAQKEIASNRIEADIKMKELGINTDILLQEMKNLNAKDIEEIRGNIQRNLENLKHENLTARMMVEFANELKLHNFDAKATMRQVLINNIAKLIGDGKTPWGKIGNVTAWEIASDIVDTTMKPVLDKLDDYMKDYMPDLSELPALITTGLVKGGENGKPKGKDKPETDPGKKPEESVPEKEPGGEEDLKGSTPYLRPGQKKESKPHVKNSGRRFKK